MTSETPIKILLVEDNLGDVRLLREGLTEGSGAPFELEVVDRLSAGLERLAKGGIDLVFLDLGLPDCRGLDTLTRAHAAALEVPIVILTALDDETTAVHAVQHGAQDYLTKGDIEANLLRRAIRYAIERKRAEQELKVRARQQGAVAELGQQALAGIELSALMNEAVALLAQILDVEYCKVLELLPDGNALLLRAGVGWKEGYVGQATVGAGTDSQAGYTLLSNEPVIVEDLRTETRFSGPPLLLDHGVVSGMSVIIRGQDQPFGVLGAHTTRRRTFTNDDSNFLEAVANLLATAVERKRAEEALREMNVALAHAMPGISRLDAKGRYVTINEAYARMIGYEPSEMVGMDWALTVHPDDRGNAIIAYHRMVSEGIAEFEARAVRKDGSMFHEHVLMVKIVDKDDTFVRHHCFMRDITERKRAEEALRESEGRFRNLVQEIDAIVWEADAATWKFTFVSERAETILGYPTEQWLTEPAFWANHIHPDDREQTVAHCREATLASRDHEFEYRSVAADGRVVWLRDMVRVIRDAEGRARQLRGLMVNITERKRVEETLQALYRASLQIQEPLGLQKRLSRLLETAQSVLGLDRVNILLADAEGQWLQAVASSGTKEPLAAIRVPIGPEGGGIAEAYLTRQMVVWDGLTPVPEPLRLKPPYDRIAAFRSQVFVNVPLVVQGRAIGVLGADRKYSRRPLDAATLELLQLFAGPAALAIEHGRLNEQQRLAAIQLEATVEARTQELQLANRQLEEASHHKSEFLANMSHELRTPLNSILGFSELLRDPTFGPLIAKQARYVDHIHRSGQHLLALINDLLDLSKVEAGKIELRPETFDLREALTAALTEIRPQAMAKRLQLELQVDPALATLTADPVRFKQILFNLLSNAIKFTPGGGRVTVTARRVPSSEFHVPSSEPGTWDLEPGTAGVTEFIEIAVQDTGIGIKAEDLPRLFQEFVQLEAVATKRYEGTGLGLALTRRLVELHGGRIWAESAGEGRGSTFTVHLPLSPAG